MLRINRRSVVAVSDGMYLTLMLGALALLIAILVPTMFFAHCKNCRAWNSLDALQCRKCNQELPQ